MDQRIIPVGLVWAGFPVGHTILTGRGRQYVAYYDERRLLPLGQRALDSGDLRITRLSEELGWDSHNGISLGLDAAGHLHLSGNMHSSPLIYFRAGRPDDASSLERIDTMLGLEEEQVT